MNRLARIVPVSMVVAITGCAGNNTPTAPAVPDAAHNSRNALDWAGTYRGVLPCADCEGIETVLTLTEDGSFREHSRYLGKPGPEFSRQGAFTWSGDGGSVALAGDPATRFRVGENHLLQLALDGSVITGALATHYQLTMVSPQLTGWQWKLVELRGQPVSGLERNPFIQLDAGTSRVSGFGGCNSLSGSYTLDEATLRIRFEQMVSTLRACVTGMEAEQALHEVLQTTDNYSFAGDQLSLNRARMAPLARFEASFPAD